MLNAELARTLVGLDPVVLPRLLVLFCHILTRKVEYGTFYMRISYRMIKLYSSSVYVEGTVASRRGLRDLFLVAPVQSENEAAEVKL